MNNDTITYQTRFPELNEKAGKILQNSTADQFRRFSDILDLIAEKILIQATAEHGKGIELTACVYDPYLARWCEDDTNLTLTSAIIKTLELRYGKQPDDYAIDDILLALDETKTQIQDYFRANK